MDAYHVIFTGRIAEGMTQQQVEEKLQLLGCPADSIQSFFQGKARLLKKNLPRNRAELFAMAFTQAGAICRVQKSDQEFKHAVNPENPASGADPFTVVSPVIGPTQLALTPMQSPFLTAAEGGININRRDRTFVSFEDIALVAAAYDSGRGKQVLRLLVFIRKEKRPVIVDVEKIAFSGFPDVTGNNLLSSFRRFLTFLLEKNSRIMIDEETHAFLKGSRPSEKGRDIDALATALAALVPAEGGGGKAVKRKSPPAPVRPTAETGGSCDPARGALVEPVGKSAAQISPIGPVADEPILDKDKIRRMAIIYFVLSLFFCLGLVSSISQIGKGGASSRSNWSPSFYPQNAGSFFKESPALKKQRESLEYNRKMAKVTNVLKIVVCVALAFFFFRKAKWNWETYRNLN